jgi:hypothetical protein
MIRALAFLVALGLVGWTTIRSVDDIPWWGWLLFANGFWAAGLWIALKRKISESSSLDMELGHEGEDEGSMKAGALVGTFGLICGFVGILSFINH